LSELIVSPEGSSSRAVGTKRGKRGVAVSTRTTGRTIPALLRFFSGGDRNAPARKGCDETHKEVTCFVTGCRRILLTTPRERVDSLAAICDFILHPVTSDPFSRYVPTSFLDRPKNGTGLEMHDDYGSTTKLPQLTFGETGGGALRRCSHHSASRPRSRTNSLLSHWESRPVLRTTHGVPDLVRAKRWQGSAATRQACIRPGEKERQPSQSIAAISFRERDGDG
jgi:hypothetical protein